MRYLPWFNLCYKRPRLLSSVTSFPSLTSENSLPVFELLPKEDPITDTCKALHTRSEHSMCSKGAAGVRNCTLQGIRKNKHSCAHGYKSFDIYVRAASIEHIQTKKILSSKACGLVFEKSFSSSQPRRSSNLHSFVDRVS